jgi:amino acid transporter
VLLAIAFFLLTTFSIVSGYGLDTAAKQWPTDSGGAVVGLSAQFLSLTFGTILLLLLAISSFASALGTANFTTRVAFSWGHDGYLPRAFASTHPRFRSPHVAIGALAVAVAAMFVGGLIWQGSGLDGGLTYFSWLLQAGATGILPVYACVAIGGALHASRHGGNTVVDVIVAPILALVVVVLAEWSEFVEQSSPFKYAPYFMLAWIVAGVLIRLATRARVEESAEPTAAAAATPAAKV